MNDIIVSIDRSDTARRTLQTAAALATSAGVNLHVVLHAERTRPVGAAVGTDRFHRDWFVDAEHYLTNATALLQAPSITTASTWQDPVAVLCEEAERLQARLIVIGNRRGRGIRRAFGSVTRRAVRQAPCEVVAAAGRDRHTASNVSANLAPRHVLAADAAG
jgi:nucleotide-binding universal stress UspA family protein